MDVPAQCRLVSVCCGSDFTFLLTSTGRLLGFGNNEENQLGIDTPQSLRKRQIKVCYLSTSSFTFQLRKLSNFVLRWTEKPVAPSQDLPTCFFVAMSRVNLPMNLSFKTGSFDKNFRASNFVSFIFFFSAK